MLREIDVNKMDEETRAAITKQAVQVLGSMSEARRWLAQPAVAFNARSPIDLLSTRQGAELVRDQLVRMEFGVYA